MMLHTMSFRVDGKDRAEIEEEALNVVGAYLEETNHARIKERASLSFEVESETIEEWSPSGVILVRSTIFSARVDVNISR